MGYLSLQKKMGFWYTSVLLGFLIAAVQVHGQPSTLNGFISINCGATRNSTDSITRIPYTTDGKFIGTGKNYNVSSKYLNTSLPKQYLTVRSFPKGDRNCYTLRPAVKEYKYLLRAGFMYGNYDGKNSVKVKGALQFGLYIGVNLWKTVNITSTSNAYVYEAIIVALVKYISVCLIRTGSSTPFISLLEMRQLKTILYPTATSSEYIVFLKQQNLGATTKNIIRYPDDPYDRIWKPMNITSNVLTAKSRVRNYPEDQFEVPSAVHQTAAVSASVKNSIEFSWDAEINSVGVSPYYYVNLHISELQHLSAKDLRELNIYDNGGLLLANYRPPYHMSGYIYSISALDNYIHYRFILNATEMATRPPLINAVEIYSLMSIANRTTQLEDVDAMLAIKAAYKVTKNWMGDPCLPEEYAWYGLSCSNDDNSSRIIAVNLSYSGLVGTISNSFTLLKAINFLDLSYNNLTGSVPDFLADIESLHVLNLTGNNFTGVMPDALLKKSLSGSLILRY